ncbi:MAG: tetratricopeptide repeat protein [Candidatus Lokiarchaeota archaeon]|nr:tetratricopeptide repeat protein [Candidatus Lokiarchaeota archaeon]
MNAIFDEIIESSDKFTFLVGAGISMEYPSSVPSAKHLVESLARRCVPNEELHLILQKETLRYEVFVEVIQKYIDPSLRFLDFLETRKKPNLIHYFLAHIILDKNYVITTNFDYLIEYALINLLPVEERQRVNPIITKSQFLDFNEGEQMGNTTNYLLFKLHGSKKNVITGKNTSESLITTISSLGKDRKEGETFTIEPYKKSIVAKIIKDRVLIVLGYSGSDDFDITPFLKEFNQYKKIIWINHIPKLEVNDIEINNFSSNPNAEFTRQEKFLYEIKKKYNIETYFINVNTKEFISEILWKKLLNTISIPKIENDKNSEFVDFNNWIDKVNEYKNKDMITRYKFVGYLYYSFSDWKNARRVWQKGLEKAKFENNLQEEAEFLTNVATLHSNDLNTDKSLEMLETAKKIYTKLNDYKGKSSCLNNIGLICSNKAEFEKAINYYLESLELNKVNNNLEGSIVPLLNLGAAYGKIGDNNRALQYYQNVIDFVKKTGDLQYKAQALMNIGIFHRFSGDYKKALKYFEEALQIDTLLGTIPEQTVRLNYIGLIHQDLGEYNIAFEYFNKGLQLAIEINDYQSKVSLLHMIGNLHDHLNQYEEAKTNWKKALNICDDYDMILEKVNILNSMGSSAYNLGNFNDAMELFRNVLELAHIIDDKNFIIESYNSIAVVSHSLEDYESAYNYYIKILDLLKEENDMERKAIYLKRMGIAYYSYTGDKEMTMDILKNAQEIFESLGDIQAKEEIERDIESIQNQ